MKLVLEAVLVVLSVLKGCTILPLTVVPCFVNVFEPYAPDIDVRLSNNTVPVTSILVVSQPVALFKAGIEVEETAESNVVIPEPVILMFDTEQLVVVGKLIAVPF